MKHLVKHARWYWIAWFAVAFLPVELYGVFNTTPGDTFSETWWTLFGILGHVPAWWHIAGILITLVTGVWLTGHLAFGWWGGPTPFGHMPKGTAERVATEIRDTEELRRKYEIGPLSSAEVVALIKRLERR